jgi:hypothetical protein
MSQRHLYGDPSVLPDATIVAKILITAAKLFNTCHNVTPKDVIADALETLQFYASELIRRHSISEAPASRHSDYNSPFPVASILKPLDYAALILQKAIRLHSIFHQSNTIHHDSTADLLAYLKLIQNTYLQQKHQGKE